VKKLVRLLAVLLFLIVCAGVGGYFYLQQQFRIPHSSGAVPVIIEISKGSGTRDVLRLLREHNIILNEYVALGYLALSGSRGKLQAGEYMFDMPMTVGEVLEKIANGRIYLHKFTVPEGLTVRDTAARWEEQGFGSADGFLSAAEASVSLIHDLDKDADSLEGYLFPETYSFPIRTTPAKAVAAMVGRFHEVIAKLQQRIPPDQWPPNLHQTVILASIVESEAAHDDERATIASVYQNRLMKNMLLQCDTTVIYALARENKYRGTLLLKDLKFNSSYNTYVYPGLPPGAIMNPGYESLTAALQPAKTNYIYFVRTNGGRHTFSETLAAHNKAVALYRAMRSQSK
jgi:UPF0755 protein